MAETLIESRIVYFYEAVRCGTIRAAADSLNVAPSAVSRQIGLLETELDVTLIERHARGVKPTEAGEHVIEYFREQLAHKDDLLRGFRNSGGFAPGISVLFWARGLFPTCWRDRCSISANSFRESRSTSISPVQMKSFARYRRTRGRSGWCTTRRTNRRSFHALPGGNR